MEQKAHDDRDPRWRVWLPPVLILGSPWLAAAVTIVVILLANEFSPASTAHRIIAFVNLALAAVGSGAGAVFIRAPLPIRIAVMMAVLLYGLETYLILLMVVVNLLSDVISL